MEENRQKLLSIACKIHYLKRQTPQTAYSVISKLIEKVLKLIGIFQSDRDQIKIRYQRKIVTLKKFYSGVFFYTMNYTDQACEKLCVLSSPGAFFG